jgi:transcriptional regulator with XRE-family HTH domain
MDDSELRVRRVLAKVRQQDVCIKVGISQAELSNIERGYKRPTPELAEAIRQAILELGGTK